VNRSEPLGTHIRSTRDPELAGSIRTPVFRLGRLRCSRNGTRTLRLPLPLGGRTLACVDRPRCSMIGRTADTDAAMLAGSHPGRPKREVMI
jgi:hypothetical protein